MSQSIIQLLGDFNARELSIRNTADAISTSPVRRFDVLNTLHPINGRLEFYWIHMPAQDTELSENIRRQQVPMMPPEFNNVAIRFDNGKSWAVRYPFPYDH